MIPFESPNQAVDRLLGSDARSLAAIADETDNVLILARCRIALSDYEVLAKAIMREPNEEKRSDWTRMWQAEHEEVLSLAKNKEDTNA